MVGATLSNRALADLAGWREHKGALWIAAGVLGTDGFVAYSRKLGPYPVVDGGVLVARPRAYVDSCCTTAATASGNHR
jgi:hypothetical protein